MNSSDESTIYEYRIVLMTPRSDLAIVNDTVTPPSLFQIKTNEVFNIDVLKKYKIIKDKLYHCNPMEAAAACYTNKGRF